MADAHELESLLREVLDGGRSPEEVCAGRPELEAELRRRLTEVRALDAELAALFPNSSGATGVTDEPLPDIPGYEVQGILGRGGMGLVLRAVQINLNRPVAIKMMLTGVHAAPVELQRFLREAEAVARLRHGNIVQVHDAGEHAGRPYFTMELLEGGNLADRLGGRPQRIRESAELLTVLARAVHAAHEAGIVHRDLKPANILLARDGTPKISDFGLARFLDGDPRLTSSGARLGTPSYMAPEQALGRSSAIGPAVDVYALGVLLYEMLTGGPPFQGETASEVERRAIHEEPVPPVRRRAGIPKDLGTICLTCLHKEPERRYASAEALAADLDRFLRHDPILARPIGRLERCVRWARRNPTTAALSLLSLLLLGFLLARGVTDRILAAERRAESERWSLRVEDGYELLREGRLSETAALLAGAPKDASEALRARTVALGADLELLERLDGIRMGRAATIGGRFDHEANRENAARAYAAAFADAALARPEDAPASAASRIAASPVSRALVAALDDWALCEPFRDRKDWLLDVARLADPDPSGWRDRVRDPKVCGDPESLTELALQSLTLPKEESSVSLLVHLGERLREHGVDVVRYLRSVQQAHPSDFWASFTLGEVLFDESPAEALRYFQAAVAIRPDSVLGHVNLGRTLATIGANEEAIEVFERAIRLDPEFARIHSLLGRLFLETGRHEEAMEELELAVALEPTSEYSHYCLASGYAAAQRWDEALASFAEAARLAPHLPENRFSHAYCLLVAGRYEQAREEYEAGFRLSPGTPQHRASYAWTLDRLGQSGHWEDLRRAWAERLGRVPEGHTEWDGYAELCLFLGDVEEYRRACRALLERFAASTDPHVLERTGRACLLLPGTDELATAGCALVDRAYESDPALSAAWAPPFFALAKALAELRRGRPAAALELVRGRASGALQPAPQLVECLALRALGEEELALAAFASALLLHDWGDDRPLAREDWIHRILRREIERSFGSALEGDAVRTALASASQVGAACRSGRHADAAEHYSRVFERFPELTAVLDGIHASAAESVAAAAAE